MHRPMQNTLQMGFIPRQAAETVQLRGVMREGHRNVALCSLIVAVGLEQAAFDLVDPAQAPGCGSDAIDQYGFDSASRLQIGVQAPAQGLINGGLLVRQKNLLAKEAVPAGVLTGDALAQEAARSGAPPAIATIPFNKCLISHALTTRSILGRIRSLDPAIPQSSRKVNLRYAPDSPSAESVYNYSMHGNQCPGSGSLISVARSPRRPFHWPLAFDPHTTREEQRLREMFKGTTPHGREIIRKRLYALSRRLFPQSPVSLTSGSVPAAAGNLQIGVGPSEIQDSAARPTNPEKDEDAAQSHRSPRLSC